MFVLNWMAIHPTAVEIFQSRPKCQTDRQTDIAIPRERKWFLGLGLSNYESFQFVWLGGETWLFQPQPSQVWQSLKGSWDSWDAGIGPDRPCYVWTLASRDLALDLLICSPNMYCCNAILTLILTWLNTFCTRKWRKQCTKWNCSSDLSRNIQMNAKDFFFNITIRVSITTCL